MAHSQCWHMAHSQNWSQRIVKWHMACSQSLGSKCHHTNKSHNNETHA
jgi:hypothetical protein